MQRVRMLLAELFPTKPVHLRVVREMESASLVDEIGRPGASRAVGRANGDNRLAIIVPCHRVVRANGSLCGYGGGLWRKKWLLEHERRKLGTVTRFSRTNTVDVALDAAPQKPGDCP